jgi:O-antigen/teichoic acid export membrane protein
MSKAISTDAVGVTASRVLVGNVGWNLAGQGLPLLVALVAIPPLIHGLGTDRFGIVTLAWVFIGYFSILDLGIGRALTQMAAERLAAQRRKEVPVLVWTSLALMVILGLAGTVVAAVLSPWLIGHVLHIPPGLQPETVGAFYLLAAAIPIVILSAVLRGLLEAHQRFKLVSAIRGPLGAFTFLGPLAVLPVSHSVFAVVLVLFGGRLVALAAFAWASLRVMPELRHRVDVDPARALSLLRFGGWMTVSNVVSPLMVYLDRFLVAATLTVTAVAFYATPYEMVTRLLVIPAAIAGVLFPAFAGAAIKSPEILPALLGRSLRYTLLILLPITLAVVALAYPGLHAWLGPDFALNSTAVLQWLALGVLANSLAAMPYALIQGIGRPDLTAKLHLAELPVYLALLWWLLHAYGITGAAVAWTLRVSIDCVLLLVIARQLIGHRPLWHFARSV